MERLGFKKDSIIETIVTTFNEDGSPNAAPMGVTAAGRESILLRVHTDSDTYFNIVRNRGCVVNLVYDPLLFLRTALLGRGRGGEEPEVSGSEIGRALRVKAPFLKEAHAYFEASLRSRREYLGVDEYGSSEVSVVKCRVVRTVVKRRHPVGFNRGLAAAVELAIKLSRGQRGGAEEQLEVIRRTLGEEMRERILVFLRPYL